MGRDEYYTVVVKGENPDESWEKLLREDGAPVRKAKAFAEEIADGDVPYQSLWRQQRQPARAKASRIFAVTLTDRSDPGNIIWEGIFDANAGKWLEAPKTPIPLYEAKRVSKPIKRDTGTARLPGVAVWRTPVFGKPRLVITGKWMVPQFLAEYRSKRPGYGWAEFSADGIMRDVGETPFLDTSPLHQLKLSWPGLPPGINARQLSREERCQLRWSSWHWLPFAQGGEASCKITSALGRVEDVEDVKDVRWTEIPGTIKYLPDGGYRIFGNFHCNGGCLYFTAASDKPGPCRPPRRLFPDDPFVRQVLWASVARQLFGEPNPKQSGLVFGRAREKSIEALTDTEQLVFDRTTVYLGHLGDLRKQYRIRGGHRTTVYLGHLGDPWWWNFRSQEKGYDLLSMVRSGTGFGKEYEAMTWLRANGYLPLYDASITH